MAFHIPHIALGDKLWLLHAAAFVYYITVSVIFLTTDLYITIPHIYADYDFTGILLRYLLTVYIFFNMVANHVLCTITDTTYRNREDPEPVPRSWGHCMTCQVHTPPRTWHCSICHNCVLRRDHHCFFTASCVGHHNQRYFIVLSFHVAVGSLYTGLLNAGYLHHYYVPFSGTGVFSYLFPVAFYKLIAGQTTGFLVFMLVMTYVAFGMSIMTGTLFGWHMLNAYNGQTSWESHNEIRTYDQGPAKNLYEIFGSFWVLSFLIPRQTALPGDGIDWRRPKPLKSL
ncbi:palmitoyltransferase ZDHHC22-like [Branchiostoma floridae x Branchiostoma belcheri]